MSQTITQGRLRIDANFKRFVDEEVLPGVELTLASFFLPANALIREDLPTLERPARAICASGRVVS